VYLVTARHLVNPGARTASDELVDFERWLDEAIKAGVDAIQVREPDLDPAVLVPLASRLVARTRGTPTRLFVNDRADVAIAARADGVHLRGTGPTVDRVRALGGPSWIVGRSVHRASEAAVHRNADYLLFGTVFSSESKPAGAAPAGLDSLRSAVGAAGTTPVVAIGGVTPERARACLAAGAAGVAAIGAFLPQGTRAGALGPADAVAAFRAAIDEGSAQR
jgi:thiamine-phosphate pyrophosphorylase